jgi:predicted CopG family antitoxin
MNNQVNVTLDKNVYDQLARLQAESGHEMSEVIGRLLFHGERKMRLEGEETHYTMEQELQRERDGVFASSGICS